MTGTPDEPSKAGPSIADIAAGMYAYTSILAALLQRQQTGRGQHIDVSMLESLVEWTSYPLYYAFDGAPPPPRTGAAHATIYPYGPFPAGDGGTVMLGLQNEREWAAFCEKVLLQPALAADARFTTNSKRVAARDALRAIIVEAFASLSVAQVVERLEAAQIANARVNTMAEVWAAPAAAGARALARSRLAGRAVACAAAARHLERRAAHGSCACARRAHRRDPRGTRHRRRRACGPARRRRHMRTQ